MWRSRLRVFGIQAGAHWLARPMPPGWMAVVSRGGGGAVIALADDVPAHLVAAAVRHVLTAHDERDVTVCRAPACAQAEQWRTVQPVLDPAVASTA